MKLLCYFIYAMILFCRPYRIVTITRKIKYFSWRPASCCSLPGYQYFDEKFQFTIYRKRQNKNLCHYEGTIIFKSCDISRFSKGCFNISMNNWITMRLLLHTFLGARTVISRYRSNLTSIGSVFSLWDINRQPENKDIDSKSRWHGQNYMSRWLQV